MMMKMMWWVDANAYAVATAADVDDEVDDVDDVDAVVLHSIKSWIVN